jgi:hypothetical protein
MSKEHVRVPSMTRSGLALYCCLAQRLLAMTACIWHSWQTGAPELRSLTANDH